MAEIKNDTALPKLNINVVPSKKVFNDMKQQSLIKDDEVYFIGGAEEETDASGNKYITGNLYINCNKDFTGGNKVATESYVDNKEYVHVGNEQPSNTNVLWVNTASSPVKLYYYDSGWKSL